jgi:hypothetical protein
MLKKFEKTDIFINKIKTYPRVRVFTYSGSMYYNNEAPTDINKNGVTVFHFLMEPEVSPGIAPANAIETESGTYLLTENNVFITTE